MTKLTPVGDQGNTSTRVAPVFDQGKTSTSLVADSDQGKASSSVAPVGDQGKTLSKLAPVGDQGKTSTCVAPLGDQFKTCTKVAQGIDQGNTCTSVASVRDQRKASTILVPIGDQRKTSTIVAPAGGPGKRKTSTIVPPVGDQAKTFTGAAPVGDQGEVSSSVAPVDDQRKVATASAPVSDQGKVPTTSQPLSEQEIASIIAAAADKGKSSQVTTYSKVSRPCGTNNRGTTAVTETSLKRRSASNLTVAPSHIQQGTADMLSPASVVQADGMDHNVDSDVDGGGNTRQKVIGREVSANKEEDDTQLRAITENGKTILPQLEVFADVNGETVLRIPLPENSMFTYTPSVQLKGCNKVVFSIIILPKDGGKCYSSKMKEPLFMKIGQVQVCSVEQKINVSGHLTYSICYVKNAPSY